MTKYALLALVVICITVLCFSMLMKEKPCSLSINSSSMVVKASLAYEVR